MAKQGNIENIFPLIGMNKDDDPRYFEQGEYADATNVRIGSVQEQGDGMLVQKIKSNLDISLTEFDYANAEDPGIDKLQCLGTAIDKKNKIAYLFYYLEWSGFAPGKNYEFAILKHDLSDDSHKLIFKADANDWGIKAWDSDMLRIESEVVDGKIIFTDGFNNIRYIDVNRIETSYDNDIITSSKWDFTEAFYTGYSVGTKVYYLDKVYNVIQNPFEAAGTAPDITPLYYTEICDIVDCYLNTDDPDLFVLAAIPPLSPATISYGSNTSINQNNIKGYTWQFSYRYIYLDYRKSKYAQPSLIAEPSGEEYNTSVPYTIQTFHNYLRITCNIRNEEIRAIEIVGHSSEDPATWFLLGKIIIIDDTGIKNYSIGSVYFDFYNDKSKTILTLSEVYELFSYVPIRAKSMSLVEGNRLVFANIQENYSQIEVDVDIDLSWETLTAGNPLNKYRTLKKGVTQQWGLIYRDIAGRITPIMGEDILKLYIPFVTESTDSNINRKPSVRFYINHLPPDYAVSYEIVYLGNSLNAGNTTQLSFFQMVGYNILSGKIDHDDPSVAVSNTDIYTYRLEIKRAIDYTREKIKNWSLSDYVWEKGDRIRIIGKVTGTLELSCTELTTLFDLEIFGVFSDTDYDTYTVNNIGGTGASVVNDFIYFPAASGLGASLSSPSGYTDLFVEIYRPLNSDSNIYFTTGMVFEIGTNAQGNKYHKGNTNQILNVSGVSTSSAIILNTSSDVWMYQRNVKRRDSSWNPIYTDNSYIWVESEYPSDFHVTEKLTPQGQPLIDIASSGTGLLPQRLRHGGVLEVGTQINNIAKFDAGDFKDLKVIYGPITKIVLVGFILKVIQHLKVTSIYISRLESYTASQQLQYTFTDSIFGTVRPFEEDWGSRHPGSIIVEDNDVYFWDDRNSIVARNSFNGQQAISNNKMSRAFRDIANSLKSYDLYNQVVEFGISKDDFGNMELFCVFGNIGSINKTMYVFNETRKRWTYKVTVYFDYARFYWDGNNLYNTYISTIYKWFADNDYQRISGTYRTGTISLYTPVGPMRIFNTIVVYQDEETPVFASIIVPERYSGTGRDMETNIYAVNIQQEEGMFYCQILNDLNTPGLVGNDNKLLNGDVLRGLLLNVVLQFTGNSKVTLSNIEVVSTLSKLKL